MDAKTASPETIVSKRPPMLPGLGRDIHYVEGGVVMPGKVVFIRATDPMCVNLVCWNASGDQRVRCGINYGGLDQSGTWFWPEQQHVTVEQLKAQGEEFRKQFLSQAAKLHAEGKMSKEQLANLEKSLAHSPNPPVDKESK